MSLEGVCVDEKATKKRSKNDELPTCFFIPVIHHAALCAVPPARPRRPLAGCPTMRVGAPRCAGQSPHRLAWFQSRSQNRRHSPGSFGIPRETFNHQIARGKRQPCPLRDQPVARLGLDQGLHRFFLARANPAPTGPLQRPGNGLLSTQFDIDSSHPSFLRSVGSS
jgi:hypothetical protein